jgi:hypothetical protein
MPGTAWCWSSTPILVSGRSSARTYLHWRWARSMRGDRSSRSSSAMRRAMSNVARGKIHDALRDGSAIGEGWAIDPTGRPTSDPTAALAGSILPSGGHKGLALATIVEVLAGVLTGARPLLSQAGAPDGVGAFGFVLDPAALVGQDAFDASTREWTSHYRAAVRVAVFPASGPPDCGTRPSAMV